MQRQASNLRLPELRTLFTIPPRSTRLHKLLQATVLRAVLTTLARRGRIEEADFRENLNDLIAAGVIPSATGREILGAHPWQEISQAIDDVLAPVRTNFRDLLDEEFTALRDASVNGAPPVHRSRPTSRVIFEVTRSEVRQVVGPNGRQLRVTPVARLQTVTVQYGYRREVPRRAGNAPGRVVPTSFADDANQTWYPGIEYLGEGLFISLAGDGWHFPLSGVAATQWEAAATSARANGYADHLFRTDSRDELHPVFVWWHTLSHLLLRSLSVDAGYSSSAIRERVYVETTGSAERARGGVILYATQPGSEGSMGGLIALAPQFQHILDRSLHMARTCSNDPLCAETHFASGMHNGPSCYGCLLVSETSCEHRNLWLDRELLNTNLP